MSVYPNLKALIAQNKLRNNDVAKLLNISNTAFSYKLNKKTKFNVDEVKKLIQLFNQAFEYIFFED